MTLKERIDELIALSGSLNELAIVLNIDKAYLSRLRNGKKVNPSNEILKKLGLYRVVEYRRISELDLKTKAHSC